MRGVTWSFENRTRMRTTIAGGAVLVALVVGILAWRSTDDRGPGGSAGAAGCDPAAALTATATVAIVDSGIDRSALPEGTMTGSRIEPSGGSSGPLAGHGTEMASIVHRAAPDARLVDVRVLDEEGSGQVGTVAAGIDAARRGGADIINLSAAVPASDPTIRSAIDRAVDDGVVVVVAAGNDARDLSRDPAWPDLGAEPCVVVVGALGDDGRPLASSNRGEGAIDAWVDGQAVPVVEPGGRAAKASGTSPAAASVTGALVAG